jgi:Fe-S oxidoreductase
MENEKIKELKGILKSRLNRPLKYYIDTCTRCGLCYDTCHAFNGIQKKEFSPVGRAEVLRKLYKKYTGLSGMILPYMNDSTAFNDTVMDQLHEAAWSCTGCRRCMVNCPFGIDTGMMMGVAKHLLVVNETAPEELVMLADAAVEKGKSIDEFKEGYRNVIRDLEKTVQKKLRLKSSKNLIPMEVKDADIMYVALAGAHSIVNPAVIFNAAKENWTLSYFEGVNFGFFAGDPQKSEFIAQRIIKEAVSLNVKEVVIVECGTAFRILRKLMGELPFKVSSIVEVIHRYMKDGRIKLKKNSVNEAVTYHDPCQLGRNGGIFDEPREILQSVASDYREMSPTKEQNWCCGGGGGLVALDNEDFRIKTGKPKKEQIVKTGAKIVVSACENCVTQLQTINSGYDLGVEVKYLTEIVCDNLVI